MNRPEWDEVVAYMLAVLAVAIPIVYILWRKNLCLGPSTARKDVSGLYH